MSLALSPAWGSPPRPARKFPTGFTERVAFKTADGWTLAALYHPPARGRPLALLVHGVGSDKHEWDGFSARLWRLDLGTLAVDLRGHGESLQGPRGPRDYRGFDDSGEWPRLEGDLEAALAFLKRRGIPPGRVGLVGASIGANLVSRLAAEAKEDEFPWIVLLSPGEDYRGVGVSGGLEGRRVFLAASPEDAYAYRTAAALSGRLERSVFCEAASGHGVQMFRDRVFLKKLLAWIRKSAAAD